MRPRGTRPLLALATFLAACGAEPAAPSGAAPDSVTERPAGPIARAASPRPGAEIETLLARWEAQVEGDERVPPRDAESVAGEIAALGHGAIPRLLAWISDCGPCDPRVELTAEVVRRLGSDALVELVAEIRGSRGVRRAIAIQFLVEADETWPWGPHGPDVARALLDALGDPDVVVRIQALERLGNAGPTGVPVALAIASRVTSENADERERARETLAWLGPDGAAAATTLVGHLASPERRGEIESALFWIGPGTPEAAARLGEFLRGDDADARSAAIRILAAWREGARPAISALMQVAAGPGDATTREALRAVREIPGAAAANWREILRIAAASSSGVRGAAQEVLADAASESPELAAAMRDAVATLPPAEAAVLLTRVLDVVRPPGLASVVTGLLNAPDAGVRLAAVETLYLVTDEPVDPVPVLALLDDPDQTVRAAAAAFLVQHDPASCERAVAVAPSLLPSSDARLWVARALAAAADPSAPGPDLLGLLRHGHIDVRREVEILLARSDVPIRDVPPEIVDAVALDAVFHEADRAAATRAALRFDGGADALVRVCAKLLSNGSREQAGRVLDVVRIAGPRAIALLPALERLAADEDRGGEAAPVVAWLTGDAERLASESNCTAADVRRLLSLGDAGGDALVRRAATWASWATLALSAELAGDAGLVRAVLRGARDPADAHSRVGAARFAPALGTREALDFLSALAADDDADVRRAVASMFARMAEAGTGMAPAAPALRALLGDGDADVRRDACHSAYGTPGLAPDLARRTADADPSVRITAAAEVLRAHPTDGPARDALFAVLRDVGPLVAVGGAATVPWDDVGEALAVVRLDEGDAAVLGSVLRTVDACDAQGAMLRALARLGPAAAPALTEVRLALAVELPCLHGGHGEAPNRGAAVAVLVAMGPAAAPALPDLRRIVRAGGLDTGLVAEARAAIAAIE